LASLGVTRSAALRATGAAACGLAAATTVNGANVVTLAAGSVHTIVVLDGTSGLKVENLTDAAASQVAAKGGAATGLGGTAPGPPAPGLAPWLATLAAGLLLAAAGGFGLRRSRRTDAVPGG